MEKLWQDLRYGARMLLRRPGFSSIAVLTLALGIGANTAIFSVVHAVLLKGLPYKDSDKLYLLYERTPKFPLLSASYPNFKDWRDMNHSFEGVAAARNTSLTLTGQGDPERIQAQMTTYTLLPLLGVQCIRGRGFTKEEDAPGGAPVALISYGLWQRRFNAADNALGQTIDLSNQPCTIIGVLPPGYQFLQPADVVVPMEPWAVTLPNDRGWHPGIQPIARLKPGMTAEQASADMQTIAKQLEQQYPIFNTNVGSVVVNLREQIVQNARQALLILFGAVGFVLLIACANVANLLIARAASRRREVAVRTALGAGRVRILRQLLTESVLLSVIGAGVGLGIASIGTRPLLDLATGSVPPGTTAEISAPVLIFTLVLAVLTGLVFGLAPALQTSRMDLREALNQSAQNASGAMGRTRAILVISELALATVLLIGAGLLMKSFQRTLEVQPGFNAENLLIVDLPLAQAAYARPEQRLGFFDRVLEGARGLPGVRSAGAASVMPVSGAGGIIHFNIQGRPPKGPGEFILAGIRTVSPDYLSTLSVPLLQGRMFNQSDARPGAASVIINRTMAQTFFPNQSPLGQHLQLGALPADQIPYMEVVGVVGDLHQALTTDPQTEMYIPFHQVDALLPQFALSLVVRSLGDPRAQVGGLRKLIGSIDPAQPLVKVRTMEENISSSVVTSRFRTMLLGIFAGLALVLATIGIYGVMSYSVSQRTREIGIRMALGARVSDTLALVIRQGMLLTVTGVAIGLGAAIGLTRLLSTMLFGVSATDTGTYALVAGVLAAVALLACYFPARRAAKVNPMIALRYE